MKILQLTHSPFYVFTPMKILDWMYMKERREKAGSNLCMLG